MKKNNLIIIFLLCVFLIPCIVKADTWLDDPSYRDLSWFNEDTYNTTYTFTIDSPAKMAGLLYLVNEKNYSFENKRILLYGNESHSSCYSVECALNMTAHDWVPFKSQYNATIVGTTDVFVSSDGEKIRYAERDKCKQELGGSVYTYDCDTLLSTEYNIHRDVNEGGSVIIFTDYNNPTDVDKVYSGHSIYIKVQADENYYADDLIVKDYTGRVIYSTKFYDSETHQIYVTNPYSSMYVTVTFRKIKEQKCSTVTGDGNNIGDEIVCGTEHFYVIDSNENEIKMLAKYNLNVGEEISKVKIDMEITDSRTEEQYCNDLAREVGGTSRRDNFYNAPGYCFIVKSITSPAVYQREDAISAHWDENEIYQYPQVGDIYISADNGSYNENSNGVITTKDFYINEASGSKYDNFFYDLDISNGNISGYLNRYGIHFQNIGVTIKSIDMLTLEDISRIIELNNLSIPYEDWFNHTRELAPPHYEFANLKDYLTEDQAFLYSTTYWLRAGYEKANTMLGVGSIVFINTAGGVCGSGFVSSNYTGYNCQTFLRLKTALGAGLRPVVTIDRSQLKHKINKKAVCGLIEITEEAVAGETIEFQVTCSHKYKVIVTKADGTVIETTDNSFIMPDGEINIDLECEIPESISDLLKNPETRDNILLLMLVMVASFASMVILRKKEKDLA